MSADKHPVEVLADECEDESRSNPDDYRWKAAEMLRRVPALEAERDQLRAEVEALREANSTFATAAILPDDKVIVDKAEIDALRADAERYRWLRGYRFIWTKFLNGDKAVALEFGFFRTNSQKPERTDLDAAIDEARKQQ